MEQVNIVALGGADTITIGDLTNTGITQVNIDLSGTPGSGTGDGLADIVIVNGTGGNDDHQRDRAPGRHGVDRRAGGRTSTITGAEAPSIR